MKSLKTGHTINLSNFKQLLAICASYDAKYNPPTPLLKIPELESILNEASVAVDLVTQKEVSLSRLTNEREKEFLGIKKLSTRILLAAKACMVTPLHYNDLVVINRRIQGRKSTKVNSEIKQETLQKKAIAQKLAEGENVTGIEPKKRNNSYQQSYDRLQSNFANLIDVLKATPEYNPNEAELNIKELENKLIYLKLANEMVLTPQVELTNARFERNRLMYLKENNLVDTALLVKKYTRSVFGVKSVQNKKLSALRFAKVKFS